MATKKTEESTVKGGSRTARLVARIAPEQKKPLLKAPARSGRVRQAMTLSTSDREVFVAVRLKAPAPGARLRKAVRRYKKQSGKSVRPANG